MTGQPKECVPRKVWKCLHGAEPHVGIMKEKYRRMRFYALMRIVQEPVPDEGSDSVLAGIGRHSISVLVLHK